MKNTPKNPNLSAQIDDAQTQLENLQMRRKDECAALDRLDSKILAGDLNAPRDAAMHRETIGALSRKIGQVEAHFAALSEQLAAAEAKAAEAAAEIETARALAEIDTDIAATVARLGAFVNEANLCAAEVETLLTRTNRNLEATGGTRSTRNAHQLLYKAQPRGLSIGECGMWGAIELLINTRAGIVLSSTVRDEKPNELERRFRM
jgi:chromosome segregation ATPase